MSSLYGFFEHAWEILWFVLKVALGYKIWVACDAMMEMHRTMQMMANDLKDKRAKVLTGKDNPPETETTQESHE